MHIAAALNANDCVPEADGHCSQRYSALDNCERALAVLLAHTSTHARTSTVQVQGLPGRLATTPTTPITRPPAVP